MAEHDIDGFDRFAHTELAADDDCTVSEFNFLVNLEYGIAACSFDGREVEFGDDVGFCEFLIIHWPHSFEHQSVFDQFLRDFRHPTYLQAVAPCARVIPLLSKSGLLSSLIFRPCTKDSKVCTQLLCKAFDLGQVL